MNKCSVLAAKILFVVLVMNFAGPFALAEESYDLDDVLSVAVVVTAPISNINPDGKHQYVITLKDGSGRVVSRNTGMYDAFEYVIRESGYVGDIPELLKLAESAKTTDVLRATLVLLQDQVKQLQAQLAAKKGLQVSAESKAPWCSQTWTRTLKVGDEGQDVLSLQKFLNAQPGVTIALSGPGAPGYESTYFGEKTAVALAHFQSQYPGEILTPLQESSGTGFFGALTQGWIERSCGIREETGSQLSVPLDALNRESDSLCYSGEISFTEGTTKNSYVAPNGLNVRIQNGYFKCVSGDWEPQEI